MSAKTEANKAIVTRHFAVVNGGDPADWDEIMAEDFVTHHPFASGRGRDRYRDSFAGYEAVFSDFVTEVHRRVAEDDYVVAHITTRGRHTGDFLGFAATGREFAFSSMAIYASRRARWPKPGTPRTLSAGFNSLDCCQRTLVRSGGFGRACRPTTSSLEQPPVCLRRYRR